MTGALQEEDNWTEICTEARVDEDTERKQMANHKPEKKAWEETSLANTLISDLSLQNCRK